MATTRSLTGCNWLIRTYASALLTAVGRSQEGSTLAGGQAINTNTRLANAVTRLNTFEANVKADYDPSWDAFWSEALDNIFTDILADMGAATGGVTLEELLTDTDVNVKRAVKTACRALELRACQFLAEGGSLP